jgi:hypothetical protein
MLPDKLKNNGFFERMKKKRHKKFSWQKLRDIKIIEKIVKETEVLLRKMSAKFFTSLQFKNN